MSVFLDISAALDGRLNTLAGSHEVAWQNRRYAPTIGTLFLRPTLLPAETVGATVSDSGTDEQTGIYQVDVFAPADEGKNDAFAKADAIAEHFKPVTELTYNGRLVRCVSASIETPLNDGDWYQLPVIIRYLSYTAKR